MGTSLAAEKRSGTVRALSDILCGAAIGIAFIIPGFSGGSVAAILGIYERLIGAVSGIFTSFRKSLRTLFPVAAGMALGVAALILPIRWGLEYFPVPTVSLFVGLALGGIPPLTKRAGKPNLRRGLLFFAACLLAAIPAFLPPVTRAEGFLYRLDFGGYALLFCVGLAAACALVVPGISGSMLLLVLGYYTPLVALICDLVLFGAYPVQSLLVLLTAGGGMAVGFFLISFIMKKLLAKWPRGTHAAILGFIVGSVAAVYAPFAGTVLSLWTVISAAALFAGGLFLSLAFVKRAETLRRP